MSLFDLALTRGLGEPFDDVTLDRLQTQTKQFSKPIATAFAVSSFIPLIIAFLVLKK